MNLQPLALIAELTHRCPLHCVYCSNPLEMQARANELSTETWTASSKKPQQQASFKPISPAASHSPVRHRRTRPCSPLCRPVRQSDHLGLPLDEAKLAALVAAGLDHIQLSFQGAQEETANEISGTKSHTQKLRVLDWFRRYRVAVTLNFVIHRHNIDQLAEMLSIAESSCATRIEFANVQYYGWASPIARIYCPRANSWINRSPSSSVNKSGFKAGFASNTWSLITMQISEALHGRWGRKLMLITPSGDALPCHAAQVISGLSFENVKDQSLREIWEHSAAFQKFRGEDWMQDRAKPATAASRTSALSLPGIAPRWRRRRHDPVCSLAPLRPSQRHPRRHERRVACSTPRKTRLALPPESCLVRRRGSRSPSFITTRKIKITLPPAPTTQTPPVYSARGYVSPSHRDQRPNRLHSMNIRRVYRHHPAAQLIRHAILNQRICRRHLRSRREPHHKEHRHAQSQSLCV